MRTVDRLDPTIADCGCENIIDFIAQHPRGVKGRGDPDGP